MIHSVMWEDLDFQRAPVRFFSSSGVPQTSWVRVGMPHIPQRVIDGVFYLFASVSDAQSGLNPGGTGFVVWVGNYSYKEPVNKYYGVTNWHVFCDFPVVRLNKKDGTVDIIDCDPGQWEFIPGKYDVGAIELNIDSDVHNVSATPVSMFLTENQYPLVGVGEDVFMLGLFFDNGQTKTNIPSARFGNVSMMPNDSAPIKQPTGYHGQSFVVDMHSRTGFSGSPVYTYRTFGSDLTESWGHEFDEIELDVSEISLDDRFGGRTTGGGRGRLKNHQLFKLMGILWGQFPEEWQLRDGEALPQSRGQKFLVEGSYVKGMSGMSCVIPAWHILEVLNLPVFAKDREAAFLAAAEREKKAALVGADPQSAPKKLAENPNHKEDFTSLLSAAAKTPKPDEQT